MRIVVAIAMVALSLACAGNLRDQPGIIHHVERGETLTSIGLLYGVTTDKIRRANGLPSATLLRVGQKLFVPGGQSQHLKAESIRASLKAEILADLSAASDRYCAANECRADLSAALDGLAEHSVWIAKGGESNFEPVIRSEAKAIRSRCYDDSTTPSGDSMDAIAAWSCIVATHRAEVEKKKQAEAAKRERLDWIVTRRDKLYDDSRILCLERVSEPTVRYEWCYSNWNAERTIMAAHAMASMEYDVRAAREKGRPMEQLETDLAACKERFADGKLIEPNAVMYCVDSLEAWRARDMKRQRRLMREQAE